MNIIFSLIRPPSMIENTDNKFSLAMQMRHILKSILKSPESNYCRFYNPKKVFVFVCSEIEIALNKKYRGKI